MKANTGTPPWKPQIDMLIDEAMARDGFTEVTRWVDSIGVGRSTLYSSLSGRKTKGGEWTAPSIETLGKLARAFRLPAHELLYIFAPDLPGAPQSPLCEKCPTPTLTRRDPEPSARTVGAFFDGLETLYKKFSEGTPL